MPSIDWDESFSVGINLIDEQHKMLIKRTNAISEAVEMTRGLEKIMQTLSFMIEYTEFHFSEEEKVMVENGYHRLSEHQKLHEDFKKRLNSMVQDFEEEGATTGLSEEITSYLTNWLVNHIKGIDTELGNILREKGFVG
ncbi:MAG: hemerythrin family protein [Candidatus Thorarchaeota archaeon]|nr:hemerythrin family protein [Candidatus Thorarchaeota archaeon]TFH05345.1 MAG: bacteriohemerythrin [Candidatus Thorarchaeota archaeon]